MFKFFLIYFFIFINISKLYAQEGITNIIVLPFKTYKEPFDFSKPLNISSVIENRIYTEIEISNLTLVSFFVSEEYGFYLTDDNCIDKSNYIIQNSKSFVNITNFTETKTGFGGERMVLYRDLSLKIKQYAYYKSLYIKEYNNKRKCGILGLKMQSTSYEYIQSFLKTFKLNDNINGYQWTLKYNSDNEGTLVLGDFPQNYDSNFQNYTEHTTKAIDSGKMTIEFGIRFDEINMNQNNLASSLNTYFFHELNAILVNFNFFEKVVNISLLKYINNEICEKKWVFQKYGYVRCDGNKFKENDKKSFPPIYFKSKDLNYNFELNYNDLFSKEKDGNFYFLIFYDLRYDAIKVGKPFLKKYTFTVDNDKNTISFFVEKKEDDNNSNASYIIIIIVMTIIFIILVGIIIFVLYKYLQQKQKNKKRANELDEDYEYMAQNVNSLNSNNKLGV